MLCSTDAFGMEGKTENRMWRDMKATVVLRKVSLVGVSVFTVTSIFNWLFRRRILSLAFSLPTCY